MNVAQQIHRKLHELAQQYPALQEQKELWNDLDRLVEREDLLAETAALYTSSQAIARALSERQIYQALFEQIDQEQPSEISVYRFILVEDEPIWAELKLRQSRHASDDPQIEIGQGSQSRFYLPETAQRRLLTTEEPIFMEQMAAHEELTETERASFGIGPEGEEARKRRGEIRTAAILPLAAAGQRLGVILVYFNYDFTFTPETKQLWMALVDQVSVALANRQLIEETTYRATQMDTASEVARAASSILDVEELLNAAVQLLRDRFELYYVGVFLVEEREDGPWAVLRAGTGEAGRIQLEKGHKLKVGGESMIGWAVHNRQARIALDVGKEAVHFQNPDLPLTRSEMALPLIHHSDVIGALTIQSEEPAAFSREDITFLQTAADQLAIAIENARLYERTQQELTERKRIEAEMRQSETKYRELVENANSIIFRMDTEGRITFFNEFAQRFFDYSEEEILGKHVVGTIVPETSSGGQDLAAMIDDLLANPKAYSYAENENMRQDGQRVWVAWTNKAIRNEKGEITGVLCIGNDITQARLAASELQKFSQAVEQSSSMIVITDPEGRIEYVNPKFTEVTGYSRTEVINKTPAIIQSGYTPEETYEELWQALKSGQEWHGEFYNQKKNGEYYWASASISPIKNQYGKITHYLSVQDDITERRQAEEALRETEERYRRIVEHAVGGVYQTTPAGQIQDVNPALAHILGYQSEAEVIEQITNTAHQLYVDPKRRDQFLTLIEHEQEVINFESRVYRKDGSIIWISETARPVFDEKGQLQYYEGTITDITERKRAEEALQESLWRSQLLYTISESLTTITDQQEAFETILGQYLRFLDLNRGSIVLIDQAGKHNRVETLYIEDRIVPSKRAFPAEQDAIAHYILKNPKPLIIEDIQTHPLTQDNELIQGVVESMLLVPMVIRGEVLGIISADACQPERTFNETDIEIGKAIADRLAVWLENRRLLDQTQHRSTLLQTAADVSRAASSILDTDTLISNSVNLIRDQFDFYYVGLFLVEELADGDWAVLRAGTGEAGRLQVEKGHKLKVGGESMIGWCVKNRQARIALDVGEEAVWFNNPYLPDTRSEMALPLISRDEALGALTVQSTVESAFSEEDITLLQTMADQLANALANAQLFESVAQAQREAERRLQETRAMQKLGQALAGTLDQQVIWNIFMSACQREIGFEYVICSMVDPYQERIKAVAGVGVSESHLHRANHPLDSDDIMADIIRTGQTEIIAGWDDRFNRELYEAEKHADWIRIFMPLTLREENMGLIEAGFNRQTQRQIDPAQERLLRTFIAQTVLALDNAQRYEASQRAARREALIKEITTKVRASTNLDTILQTTVKAVGEAVHSRRAYVKLAPDDNNQPEE